MVDPAVPRAGPDSSMAATGLPRPLVTEDERRVLMHTLTGMDSGKPIQRNFYVANPGHSDLPHIKALMAQGLMVAGAVFDEYSAGQFYCCTTKGAEAVGLKIPASLWRG